MTNLNNQAVFQVLSEDQLAAIREREQKAEKGPWEPINGDRIAIRVRPGHVLFEARSSDSPHTYGTPYLGGMRTDEDIDFIAHSRQDVPALLSHIDAQAEQIAALKEKIIVLEGAYKSAKENERWMSF